VAAHYQYDDHDHHLSDGLPDSEQPNRDTQAIQVKLDELIRVTRGAHVALLDLEELSDQELAGIRKDYAYLAEEARQKLRNGGTDQGVPEVAAGRVQ
jgi:hypothetical protein